MKANFETGLKVCACCKKELPLSEFGTNNSASDKLSVYCKECSRKRGANLREKYRNKPLLSMKEKKCYRCGRILPIENFHKCKSTRTGYCDECKECKKEADYKYKQTIKGKLARKKRMDKYISEGKANEYERKRFNNDSNYKISRFLQNRLYKFLNQPPKHPEKSVWYQEFLFTVGCSVEKLKKHLELQFQEGMSWDNYGVGRLLKARTWQIDHIIPRKFFDLTKEDNQRICFNYRNLQPLWSEENNSKKEVPENYQEIINNIKKELSL